MKIEKLKFRCLITSDVIDIINQITLNIVLTLVINASLFI